MIGFHAASHTSAPGPRGLPLVGPLVEYVRDPLGYLEKVRRDYGDVAYSRVGWIQTYLVSHPDDIEYVLVKNRKNYQRDMFLQRARVLFGEGLLTAENPTWKRQRKMMAPSFAHRNIRGYAETMVDCIDRAERSWGKGELIDLGDAFMELTLDIAVRCLFGTTCRDEAQVVGESFEKISDFFADATSMVIPLPLWVPTRQNRSFVSGKRALDRAVDSIIARRREADTDSTDLLGLMMAARDDEGSGMSDQQLRDEVLTLLLAGHETTALTFLYAFHLLGRHPKVLAKLQDEVDGVLGGAMPTLDHIKELPYTRQVMLEAMRLYPPAPMVGREPIEDDEIQGHTILKGSSVTMSQWVVHRDERWFDDPLAFRPERWTPEFEKSLPRFAYFPFGGGQRTCIGEAFAKMEAVLGIAMIASRRELVLEHDEEPSIYPSLTIRPTKPIRAHAMVRG